MTELASFINQASVALDAAIIFIPKVIALASVMAAFIPATSPLAIWINRLAFNFKHAQNKEG